MELKATSGLPLLRLRVARYQFPDAAAVDNEPFDINWLDIDCHFDTDEFTWDFSAPCLLTDEAMSIADWLAQVSRQAPGTCSVVEHGEPSDGDALTFLEPDLGFSVVEYPTDSSALIRVHVSFVSLDAASLGIRNDELFGSYVDIEMKSVDLAAAAAEWRRELIDFPVR